ncbi:MAG: HD-GYP domain-containing protein [Bacillota bacterium]
MRRVDVFLLQPGMKLGRNIYGDKGTVLLSAGTVLTNEYISKLIRMGIYSTYIYDDRITDVEIVDVVSQETRAAAVSQVKKLLLQAKESGKMVIDPKPIYSTVMEFADQLFRNRSLVYSMTSLLSYDEYTFIHSVNVCVLSLMTGITMGYSRDLLAELGLGAILHDIGKMRIPDEILNKPGTLSTGEFEIIKKHTVLGCEIIRSSGTMGELPSIIAHQHHECYDGSGYPQGISGDDYNEFAQIVSIADKFDALTTDRVYRKSFPAHEAYEMCAGSGNFWFKENVVKSFLENVAAYPTGTLVSLSDGTTAVVVDVPRGYSLFPRVRVILDQYCQQVKDPVEFNLYEVKNKYIVGVVSEEEYNRMAGDAFPDGRRS